MQGYTGKKTMELIYALLILGAVWLFQEKILHRKHRPSHHDYDADDPVA